MWFASQTWLARADYYDILDSLTGWPIRSRAYIASQRWLARADYYGILDSLTGWPIRSRAYRVKRDSQGIGAWFASQRRLARNWHVITESKATRKELARESRVKGDSQGIGACFANQTWLARNSRAISESNVTRLICESNVTRKEFARLAQYIRGCALLINRMRHRHRPRRGQDCRGRIGVMLN